MGLNLPTLWLYNVGILPSLCESLFHLFKKMKAITYLIKVALRINRTVYIMKIVHKRHSIKKSFSL